MNRMYNLTLMLVDLAKNVAWAEKEGIGYDKESFKEDLETLVKNINYSPQ